MRLELSIVLLSHRDCDSPTPRGGTTRILRDLRVARTKTRSAEMGMIGAREFDVIVVGAGPCGLSAAATLGQRGRRVLLVDREKFPREKVCGDAVTSLCSEHLAALGVASALGDSGEAFHAHGFGLSLTNGKK